MDPVIDSLSGNVLPASLRFTLETSIDLPVFPRVLPRSRRYTTPPYDYEQYVRYSVCNPIYLRTLDSLRAAREILYDTPVSVNWPSQMLMQGETESHNVFGLWYLIRYHSSDLPRSGMQLPSTPDIWTGIRPTPRSCIRPVRCILQHPNHFSP